VRVRYETFAKRLNYFRSTSVGEIRNVDSLMIISPRYLRCTIAGVMDPSSCKEDGRKRRNTHAKRWPDARDMRIPYTVEQTRGLTRIDACKRNALLAR